MFLVYPVIIISGASEGDTESKCFDYNVSDFISKPFKEQVVLRRVANVISLQEYQRLLEKQIEKQQAELVAQTELLNQLKTRKQK